MANGIDKFDPEKIDYIHSTYGGDHGKGKFRFVSKLIFKMKDGTKRTQIYPLGDVLCHKDSGTVLKATVIPNLTESVNKVEESSVKFVFDDKSKKWKCFSCNDEFLHLNCVVKPTAFLTGDLVFLATIL